MTLSRKQKLFTRLALVGLILISYSIYFPPFARYFVGDDYVQFDYIKEFLRQPEQIWQIFNPYHLAWYYRPLQNVWFWLNRLILGYEPFGYYAAMLPFHALAIALVYRVARQIRLNQPAALASAALFAIHSHYVDVVSWLSSFAIVLAAVFSLLTLSAWLSYLKRPSTKKLLLTAGLCLLALLTHEETVLAPPFLFLVLVVWRAKQEWRTAFSLRRLPRQIYAHVSRREWLFFALLALLLLGYLAIQFTRPNQTIDIAQRPLAEWLAYLTWPQLSGFLLETVYRFTFVTAVLGLTPSWTTIFLLLVLGALALWFWQGNWTVRLGLIWTGLHLAFIYWALWSQLPELYAGRHIYQAAIGLVLALGAILKPLLERTGRSRPKKRRKTTVSQSQFTANLMPIGTAVITAVIVAGLLIYHAANIEQTQQRWLNNVLEEARAEQQMKEMWPDITPNDHVFSYRFPISPHFTRSVVQLWYQIFLDRPGGSLEHLGAYGRATDDFLVLDYEDEQLYNLMPELQEVAETIFLWAAPPQVEVVNEAGETAVATPPDLPENTFILVRASNGNRLALKLEPPAAGDAWLAYRYTIQVPAHSQLQLDVLLQPTLAYRVRLQANADEAMTPFIAAGDPETEATWQDATIPLADYAGETITIYLEAKGTGDTAAYFANPRLTISD